MMAFLSAPAHAAWTLRGKSQAVHVPGVGLHGIKLSVGAQSATIQIARLDITAAPSIRIREITIECPVTPPILPGIHCQNGRLHATINGEAISADARLDADLTRARYHLSLGDLHIGTATGDLTVSSEHQRWTVKGHLNRIDGGWINGLFDHPLANVSGWLNVQTNAAGRGDKIEHWDIETDTRALKFSDKNGDLAGENLTVSGHLNWDAEARFRLRLSMNTGGFYRAPYFLSAERPIALSLRGQKRNSRLQINTLKFHHGEHLNLSGSLSLNWPSLRVDGLDIALASDWPDAFDTYLQPHLEREWATSGRFAAKLSWRDQHPVSFSATLRDLTLNDSDQFTIERINGTLAYSHHTTAINSAIRWHGGQIYRARIGPGELALRSANGQLRLREPTRIPIFDGALSIDSFRAAQTPNGIDWQVAGSLEPISMSVLSAALDWPQFSGTLAGVIPDVRYSSQNRQLTLGGALHATAFDGSLVIADLILRRPTSVAPELRATIGMERLNLERLTETFQFGKIQGQLSGLIRDLVLVQWLPVAFDAHWYSPDDDPLPHRISQRAVQTISSLSGNDLSSALSRGFIGLFEEFSYDRIELRCRLANEICHLDGIEPADDGGFYLVKGAGLPRIDVVGYNRTIDWPVLMQRLKSALDSSGPVVR